MQIHASTPLTRPEDMAQSRSWTGTFFAAPAHLPCSFCYDGQVMHGIPDAWHPVTTKRALDANIVETVVEGTDAATGLTIRMEMQEYRDFPVVEWVVWLTNAGSKPSPLLSDLQALDATFTGDAPILWHCNGDFWNEEGYTAQETPLPVGSKLACFPTGGRSCDGAFPYFRLQFAGGGLTLAIGWPAQWSATFTGLAEGVAMKAGQQLTNLRLQPGERIRTPRMTVLSWTGDTTRAINLWRRWYLAHILPRPDGQPLQPALAVCGTEGGEEFTGATEENQLRFLEQFAQADIDFDVWWIDAGWYPCRYQQGERRWWYTGTWMPDPERFPRGLQPIAQHAATHQARLLLWFEPERVYPDSQIWREHSEWLLKGNTPAWCADCGLLNLGISACRQWLTDYISTLIQQQGIGIYRQDFNFPPLAFWRENEPADRQGMNENLHVQGYLQYWDDLLARNPGLWIDSCASGGRRNDLETMRRSVPLHYSDYGYSDHPVKAAFHHTLYQWLPYIKDIPLPSSEDPQPMAGIDSYAYHCAMAAMLFAVIDLGRDEAYLASSRNIIGIWRRAADYLLYGDYYPLTPTSRSGEQWIAWQFDRPEHGSGVVQGIRHAACPDEALTVMLHELDLEAGYLFENPETGEEISRTGADIVREGLTLSLPPRAGGLWFYRKQ